MKFTISNEKRAEVLQSAKQSLESALLLRLSVMGVDPDTFDPDTFVPNEDSTMDNDIKVIIDKIKDLDIKLEAL
jgi:hypothetical protein